MRMTNLTATAVALTCVGHPPPQPDEKTAYGGEDTICCVCGGPADGHGRPFARRKVLAETFMRPDDMAYETSAAVCGACVFFTTPGTFRQCVEHQQPDVKLWPQASWRSYSHMFAWDEHRVMKPADWREVLLDPPPPPFVAVASLKGKKNIVHRAPVALSRECFPVQFEEDRVWVRPKQMAVLISLIEGALAAGWTRDEVLAGECRQSTAFRMGLGAWMSLRADLHQSKAAHALSFQLGVLVAHRPDNKENANVH